mgnify:CR=1 FL=1
MSTPFLAAFLKAIIVGLLAWWKARQSPSLPSAGESPAKQTKWGGDLTRALPSPDDPGRTVDRGVLQRLTYTGQVGDRPAQGGRDRQWTDTD